MSGHGGDRASPSRVSNRGQSTLIGIVLLLGMVGTLSVGLFLVGGEAVSSLEQQSERERVESAFVELSHQMAAASDNRSGVARTINLDVGQEGTVVRENTGNITVSSEAIEEGTIDNMTIGTIEWEDTDGSVLAYEAGAVFRERGNETQVVSAPAISYEHSTDTLTLPVITATGDEHLGYGDITLSSAKTTAYQDANVVENESVTIIIESEYYRGWETFFRSEAGDVSVRDVDHRNETVEVRVGYLELEEAYEDGILVSENYDDFENANVNESYVNSGSMPELDDVIEEMADDARANGTRLQNTSGIKDPDTYWTDDEVVIDDTLQFDTESDNTTVIVDNDVTITGTLEAVPNGSDHELKIYTTGNFHVDGGTVSVDGGDAASLQVYGTSDTHVGFGTGSTEFTGTLYATSDSWDGQQNEVFHQRNCDHQVCVQSDVDFTGALITSSTDIHSASVDFEYDPALADADIELYPDGYSLPPQLTYLNVAHHEIDVRN